MVDVGVVSYFPVFKIMQSRWIFATCGHWQFSSMVMQPWTVLSEFVIPVVALSMAYVLEWPPLEWEFQAYPPLQCFGLQWGPQIPPAPPWSHAFASLPATSPTPQHSSATQQWWRGSCPWWALLRVTASFFPRRSEGEGPGFDSLCSQIGKMSSPDSTTG